MKVLRLSGTVSVINKVTLLLPTVLLIATAGVTFGDPDVYRQSNNHGNSPNLWVRQPQAQQPATTWVHLNNRNREQTGGQQLERVQQSWDSSMTSAVIQPSIPQWGEDTGESLLVGDITEFRRDKTVTFVASNKTAEAVNMTDWRGGQLTHVVQLSPEFNPQTHHLLRGSHVERRESILPSQGLVHTVLTAYKDHHNLILSPDDIWIAILVQLSRYVNANAEELRHRFVSHNGTLTLSFEMNSLNGSSGNGGDLTREEWKSILTALRSKLDAAVNPSISSFVANTFSTTGIRMRIASSAVFLSTMQQYFKYEAKIMCGIPRITILGNKNDWEKIKGRVEFLRTFGTVPAKWSAVLGPIIDQFIRAKEGDIDAEFWGDIVRIQKNTLCGGMTGASEVITEDILDGWLSAFAVFDAQGKWKGEKLQHWKWPRINMKHVSSGVVTVPFTMKTKDATGLESSHDGTMFAGHMGFSVNGTTLTPYVGWAVARTAVNLSRY